MIIPHVKIHKNAIMGILSFLFGCSDSSPYQVKNGNWYYKDEVMDRQPGAGFETLNEVFARDNEVGFYRNAVITGSDGKSFAALSKNYGKDQNHVYYCDTYRKGQEYFTVKHNSVKMLPEADAASFTFMTMGYGKDRNHVFYEGNHFTVSDVATYHLLENSFSADTNKAYYHRSEIVGAEARSFKVLDSHYSKDQHQVYFSELYYDADKGPVPVSKILSGADVASFRPVESGYAVDANAVFYNGDLKGKSPSTLQILTFSYAKTDQDVYYMGKKIAGADAATFSVLENVTDEADARDKHRHYKQGVKQK